MLLIDKYIMNDAMNYEVAEEVACVKKFIKRLFIFKALGWWPFFTMAISCFSSLAESYIFNVVLICDLTLFFLWFWVITPFMRPYVLCKFIFGDEMKRLEATLSKYAQKRHLTKIKIFDYKGWLSVCPFANHNLRKIVKLIRLQKIVPKKERWTVVVFREHPTFSKKTYFTY